MSYCRWSSDDFGSDLYVYEDVQGGYTAHVAQRRRNWEPPEQMESLLNALVDKNVTGQEFKDRYDAYQESLNSCEDWSIHTEPSTGWTFNTRTSGEMAQRLNKLREEGFNVPDYAISGLLDDQNELDAASDHSRPSP